MQLPQPHKNPANFLKRGKKNKMKVWKVKCYNFSNRKNYMQIKNHLNLVKEFHEKFRVPVAEKPTLISDERSALRFQMMAEEVEEYKIGAAEKDLENIAKELADILYTTYGTILEHGLQDKIEEIFSEIHRSNLSKEYRPGKVAKGENFSKAEIGKFL